jgi:glycosyltransferase involved in cell wall biosynthesis
MTDPKVSIVIPVYNGSNYLKEAIDSALAQTYKNIEIIVVNDGSTDNGATEKIAKSYGKKIRYYSKENGGVATALNLGIEKMKGEYFSWLSHDDLYYPDKVEKQIRFLRGIQFKKVFLYANYSLLKDGVVTPVVHNHEMLVRKPRYSMLRGCVNGITVLIPKAILNEAGWLNPDLRVTQDYDYWRKIEGKYDFVHMQDVISVTRIHSDQDTQISPRVVEEGDALWIDMIKKLPQKTKIQYEGTLYNFYLEMAKFLESTPYTGTLQFCRNELQNLERRVNKQKFEPLVSVVIPFFNRLEKTVRAIKSVQQQTYKNVEIVLVDDCSTVDTRVIKRLADSHHNIKLITLPKNAGPAAARNVGIKRSTGDYVAFLDSDDEFRKDKLSLQLHKMGLHNPHISYTPYVRRKGAGEEVVGDPSLSGIVVPQIVRGCSIATPTVIVKKEILTKNNFFFNESLRIGEDTCFWLEIAKRHEFLYVDSPLTVVNVDQDTHSQDSTKLVKGIQNILTYLLTDDYYKQFSGEIAELSNYFYKIDMSASQEELHRQLAISHSLSRVDTDEQRTLRKTVRSRGRRVRGVPRRLYRVGARLAKGTIKREDKT